MLIDVVLVDSQNNLSSVKDFTMVTFERREMERFPLELPTSLFVTSQSEKSESIELVTSNVCAGGAFYNTEKPLPPGIELRINFIVPLDKLKNIEVKRVSVEVLGWVIRTTNQGMAVCFDKKHKISSYSPLKNMANIRRFSGKS